MDLLTPAETSRILACVEENNVRSLKQFTNLSQLHTIKTWYGNSLLQLAIQHQNREVFDYLLSTEYPLESTNDKSETALITSLTANTRPCKRYIDNYFANRLIKQGANTSVLLDWRYLHCAVKRNVVVVAKLLIENGLDVNAQDEDGCTLLHLNLECTETGASEIAAMLLAYGADAFIRDSYGLTPFDVMAIYRNEEVQELLFLHTFDRYRDYTINGSVLLTLAAKNPSLFFQIYKNVAAVDLDDNLKRCSGYIFTMGLDCLCVLIENFPKLMRHVLSLKDLIRELSGGQTVISFKNNLYCLGDSRLQKHLVDCVSYANRYFFTDYILAVASFVDLPAITELYCFMLSYGFGITKYDVDGVYQKFGYCELFKIMLHMDCYKKRDLLYLNPHLSAFPRLCYDFNIDLQTLCRKSNNVEHLLAYYNDPVVIEHCLKSGDGRIVDKAKSMPTIPLLIELARNAFRKYFIKKFKITTSRRFYTLLKALPISHVHEKIITLETKLY